MNTLPKDSLIQETPIKQNDASVLSSIENRDRESFLAPKISRISNLPIVLVAGGAGFIGSRICETLLAQNVVVLCVDNLTTGNKVNISKLLGQKNFLYVEHDLNSLPLNIPEKIDYIFHVAGFEEYLKGDEVNLETLLVNSLGTKNLLDLAQKNHAKFLYVSSHDIYQGAISSFSLEHYAGISTEDEKKYSHHEAKRYGEALVTSYYQKYNINSRIVRLSTVYGPGMDLETGSEFTRLIKEAKIGESLNVYGDGLEKLNPTHIADVVYGITKAMFAHGTEGKIYTVVNPKEETILSVAYLLQNILEGKPKINFLPQKENLKFPVKSIDIAKTQEDLGWYAKKELEVGLKETLVYEPPKVEEKEPLPPDKKTEEDAVRMMESLATISGKEAAAKKTNRNIKIKISFPKFRINKKIAFILLNFLLLVGFITVYPYFEIAQNAIRGINKIQNVEALLKSSDTSIAVAESEEAEKSFAKASEILANTNLPSSILLTSSEKTKWQRLLFIGQKISESSKYLSGSVAPMSNILSVAVKGEGKETDLETNLQTVKNKMALADSSLAEIEGELKHGEITIPFPEIFGEKAGKLANLDTEITKIRSYIKAGNSFLAIYPGLTGMGESQKKYLLLFQNNMELRPTGGFIGSFGILNFENGKLGNLNVNDIYAIDGQLKGHVAPPDEILHFLGQPNWYMRDSNWSPDFPVSAERAIWFLEKETGEQVDGVIAIDLVAAQKMLVATGEIKLTDLNENITSDNLFEKAETISEINFFPGSTQKKDLMGSLSKALLDKIVSSKANEYPGLIAGLYDSLNEKHIQIYIKNYDLEKQISQNNWSGEIKNDNGFSNYLMINEANLGANKANYFIKRSINLATSIGKSGGITNVLKINYENTSPADVWPGGNYKNYLRLFLPKNSKIISVDQGNGLSAVFNDTLDEKVLKNLKSNEFLVLISSESARSRTGEMLTSGQDWEKTVFGLLTEVPFKSQKTVTITYSLPESSSLNLTSANPKYNILFQKQSGTIKDPITFVLNYPTFLTPKNISKEATLSPQSITVKTDTTTDTDLGVEFVRAVEN